MSSGPNWQLLNPMQPNEWRALVLSAERLTAMTKLIGIALAQHADWQTGRDAWPSQSTLAGETRVNERTVRKHLSVLRKVGLVDRVRRGTSRGRISDEYRLTVPALELHELRSLLGLPEPPS